MRAKIELAIVLLALGIFFSNCSTTRFIEPLEKDEIAVGINAGGPVIGLGGNIIPIPLSSIYVGYGYKENLTLYGGLHTTSLLFNNLQFDVGARKNIFEGYSIYPSMSVAGSINGILGFREFKPRIFPEINVNAYWKYGRWRSYTGAQTWFDFYKNFQPTYGFGGFFVPAIVLGQDVKIGDWRVGLEYKRLAFNVPTENSVVNYITFGGIGAQGIYVSCSKSFGYKKLKENESN